MKFAVVGVSYENAKGEIVGDEVIAFCSEYLFLLYGDEWLAALGECCKPLVAEKYRNSFLIQFRAWCEFDELTDCIADIRRSLNDLWQMRYDLNQSVPSSFVPVLAGV